MKLTGLTNLEHYYRSRNFCLVPATNISDDYFVNSDFPVHLQYHHMCIGSYQKVGHSYSCAPVALQDARWALWWPNEWDHQTLSDESADNALLCHNDWPGKIKNCSVFPVYVPLIKVLQGDPETKCASYHWDLSVLSASCLHLVVSVQCLVILFAHG